MCQVMPYAFLPQRRGGAEEPPKLPKILVLNQKFHHEEHEEKAPLRRLYCVRVVLLPVYFMCFMLFMVKNDARNHLRSVLQRSKNWASAGGMARPSTKRAAAREQAGSRRQA
jgi:hypothetical protein